MAIGAEVGPTEETLLVGTEEGELCTADEGADEENELPVGTLEGCMIGPNDGSIEGLAEGPTDGSRLGVAVGAQEGSDDGSLVGTTDGLTEGSDEGNTDGTE